jgi:hypothetical protein
MKDLSVFHDDNAIFADYTPDSRDYLRDDFTINFTSAEDSIYIGLYKPFNKNYIEFKTPSVSDINLTATYWNGLSYQSLELNDDSKGFTRSGFISFEKPADWSSNTINGEDKYYIKLNADDFTAEIQGLNIVFADDNDLRKEVRCIDDYLQQTDISFIAYHTSARDEIIQTLRNGGHTTRIEGEAFSQNLTKWDLLDMGEVRQAAKYLCLSKIFFDVSENIDDKQYQRYIDFHGKYGSAFKLYKSSLDKNDDGIADDSEKMQYRGMSVSKL